MRTLLVGALCATLIGCTSQVRGTAQRCASQVCFSRTAATTPIELKRTPFTSKHTTTAAKSKKVAAKPAAAKPRNEVGSVEEKEKSGIESDSSLSAQPSLPPDHAPDKATSGIGGKTEAPESAQPPELSDRVLARAKVTVAAKMENPSSIEFVDIRAATKRPLEIVCGHVKGLSKSGATGEAPFLYLVGEDEAYIVDRNPDSMAAIMYRAQCTSPH